MKKFLFSLILCLPLLSCSKDIEESDSTASIFGVVSDIESGQPLSNVTITLYEGFAWDCLGASVGTSFTGSDGFFLIKNIDPTKSYFIAFRHSNYQSHNQRIRLKAGVKTELNISMRNQ